MSTIFRQAKALSEFRNLDSPREVAPSNDRPPNMNREYLRSNVFFNEVAGSIGLLQLLESEEEKAICVSIFIGSTKTFMQVLKSCAHKR
jgi:hypothetical protein